MLGELPGWLHARRWFGAKARTIRGVGIVDAVALPEYEGLESTFAIVQVDFAEGEPECYTLALAVGDALTAERLGRDSLGPVICRLPGGGALDDRVVYDAFADPRICGALLDMFEDPRALSGASGSLAAVPTRAYRRVRGEIRDELMAAPLGGEQSNTSLVLGDRLILKAYRHVEPGINPDVEIGSLLTEIDFAHIPAVAGSLEYRPASAEPITVAILQSFVPNRGDAWAWSLAAVEDALGRALARPGIPVPPAPSVRRLLRLAGEPTPPDVVEWIGDYLASIRVLATRTAELHRALATASSDPAFAPEPFTAQSLRSVYLDIRGGVNEALSLLARRRDSLAADMHPTVDAALRLAPAVGERLRGLLTVRVGGQRIRIHGDYHAGQVLWDGRDFIIIDFEGEPGRPLAERRLKQSALRDIAGMLRSFHYAVHGSLLGGGPGGATRPEDLPRLRAWAGTWYESVASTFLGTYLEAMAGSAVLPARADDLGAFLDALLIQKAFYEIVYELNNRPTWVPIPLRGALELLEPADGAAA